jgi:uncharacterized membrane protein YgcG
MKKTAPPARNGPAAFSIIEVVLGLALLSILIGGVFSVLRGAIIVTREILDGETRSLKVHSFCELLRRNFEQMPGNAKVNLQYWTGDMSEVAFTDYPLAFTMPGVPSGSPTVLFRIERDASSLGVQAALLYLDEEQSENWQKGQLDESKLVGRRIALMGEIASLNWLFYNDQTQEYEKEWPLTKTQRPTFVQMSLAFMDGSDPVTLVFWIPTVASPQQFTSFGNQGGAGGLPGGGGGGPPPGGGGGGSRPGGGSGGPGAGGQGGGR